MYLAVTPLDWDVLTTWRRGAAHAPYAAATGPSACAGMAGGSAGDSDAPALEQPLLGHEEHEEHSNTVAAVAQEEDEGLRLLPSTPPPTGGGEHPKGSTRPR